MVKGNTTTSTKTASRKKNKSTGPPAATRDNVATRPIIASPPDVLVPSFDYGFTQSEDDDGDVSSDVLSPSQRYVFFPFVVIILFTILSFLFHYCFLALFPLSFL
jgi:hypothetical protein